VVGISTDDVETQKRFKAEMKLPFPLLSDKDGKTASKYGGTVAVLGFANRTTYVLARDGTIQEIVSGNAAIDPGAAINACSVGGKG
jgi:peroxiredoxin Q/BCP